MLCDIVAMTFQNGPYGNMVIGALRQCGILCIGLYRYIDIKQTTAIKHRFVITNPPSDTFLYPTDQVNYKQTSLFTLTSVHVHVIIIMANQYISW